jgi:hypothetical protein
MSSAALRARIPYLIGVVICAGSLLVGYGWESNQLPIPACTFLRVTGYPCAFCGTTRSFFLMAKGHVGDALKEAPLGVLVYVAVVATLGWCLARCIKPGAGSAGQGAGRWARAGIYAAIIAAIANWVYRLAMGLK